MSVGRSVNVFIPRALPLRSSSVLMCRVGSHFVVLDASVDECEERGVQVEKLREKLGWDVGFFGFMKNEFIKKPDFSFEFEEENYELCLKNMFYEGELLTGASVNVIYYNRVGHTANTSNASNDSIMSSVLDVINASEDIVWFIKSNKATFRKREMSINDFKFFSFIFNFVYRLMILTNPIFYALDMFLEKVKNHKIGQFLSEHSLTYNTIQYRAQRMTIMKSLVSRISKEEEVYVLINTSVMVLLDVVTGICAYFVLKNSFQMFLDGIYSFNYFFRINMIMDVTEWIMGWPAGFKLNGPLDTFMGELFKMYNSSWYIFTQYFVSSLFPTFLQVILLSNFMGISFFFSVLSDYIQFSNLQVFFLHTAITKFFKFQLRMLESLWFLFRGKKDNVLRGRVDSLDYNIDQLLVGTLVFAIVSLLVPTVGIYFLFYVALKLFLVSMCFILNACVLVSKYCPVYIFFLSLLDSPFSTSNIQMTFISTEKKNGNELSRFSLVTTYESKIPIGLKSFFTESLNDPQTITLTKSFRNLI
eukprot:TRINITY_DN8666_c0_g1_i1.p1 TRINITY_DN8666_c0_g1~~TRINITY_DN8666_c0_g1_i1.p1  ORF type:complete len:531 (+),score=83.45 TRINITY_DN8666_c0_g1_i1:18-1610(+)